MWLGKVVRCRHQKPPQEAVRRLCLGRGVADLLHRDVEEGGTLLHHIGSGLVYLLTLLPRGVSFADGPTWDMLNEAGLQRTIQSQQQRR